MNRILLIGLGALGCRVAPLLAGEFEGELIVQDYDIVQEENLATQDLYTLHDVGKKKVEAAREHITNPRCTIATRPDVFDTTTSLQGIGCIIDCTDSMSTKLLINDRARQLNIPLITGAAAKDHGMAFTSVPGKACWQCVVAGKRPTDDCSQGIEPDAAFALACVQAGMALRALARDPEPDLVICGKKMHRIIIHKNPACKACRGEFTHLHAPYALEICGASGKLRARPSQPRTIDLTSLQGEIITRYPGALRVRLGQGSALVHRHGLVEFENVDDALAQRYAQELFRKEGEKE